MLVACMSRTGRPSYPASLNSSRALAMPPFLNQSVLASFSIGVPQAKYDAQVRAYLESPKVAFM